MDVRHVGQVSFFCRYPQPGKRTGLSDVRIPAYCGTGGKRLAAEMIHFDKLVKASNVKIIALTPRDQMGMDI
jgi:hypothetical protein